MKSEPFGPSSYITGSKEGSYKGGLIASIPHQKMKPERMYGLGTAGNNYWGLKPVFRRAVTGNN